MIQTLSQSGQRNLNRQSLFMLSENRRSGLPQLEVLPDEQDKKMAETNIRRKLENLKFFKLDSVSNIIVPHPMARKDHPSHVSTHYTFLYTEIYQVCLFINEGLEKDNQITFNMSAKPQRIQRITISVRKTSCKDEDIQKDCVKLNKVCTLFENYAEKLARSKFSKYLLL